MTMVTSGLVTELTNIFSELTAGGQPVSAAAKAQALANVIDAYIRSATVTVTTFSATAVCSAGPPGAVSGSATGTLS